MVWRCGGVCAVEVSTVCVCVRVDVNGVNI